MGTSLVVQPFAGMVNEVGKNVPRLLINLTEAGNKSVFEGLFGSPSLRYGREDNYRLKLRSQSLFPIITAYIPKFLFQI